VPGKYADLSAVVRESYKGHRDANYLTSLAIAHAQVKLLSTAGIELRELGRGPPPPGPPAAAAGLAAVKAEGGRGVKAEGARGRSAAQRCCGAVAAARQELARARLPPRRPAHSLTHSLAPCLRPPPQARRRPRRRRRRWCWTA